MNKSIIYSNAIISARSGLLLNGDKIRRMMAAQTSADAAKVLFECGFNEPTTLEAEMTRINRPEDSSEDWYAITDLSGKIIGETGFLRLWRHWHCTDMSMIIPDPNDQGKGYGFEAGQLMIDRAFGHYNLNRISVGVVELNNPAVKFWERLGFKKEGIQEQGYFYNGEYSNFIMMRLLRSEL